jgi:hypothetical protein
MDDDALPPPAKRGRRTTIISTGEPVWGPDVMVRLLDEDARNLGLSHPIIMEFHQLDYLTFNSSTVSYLYLICATIFDIDNQKITLTHSPTVKTIKSLYEDDDDDDDDDDTGVAWPVAEDVDQISKGTYCIIFDTDARKLNVILGLIVLESNLDLFNIQKKPEKSQAAEQTSTPVKPFTIPPPEKTPAQRTPFEQTASPAIPPPPNPSSESIEQLVIDRDGGCILMNIRPSMCIMSHIIPKALIEVWSSPS